MLSLETGRRPRRVLVRTLGLAGVATLLGAATVGILTGGGTAKATTANETGLPTPPTKMPLKYVYPIIGRFFLTSVSRQAHLTSGLLDMEIQAEEEWLYGELELHSNTAQGTSTTTVAVWLFEYAKGRVSARLVAHGSVSNTHPDGITVGRISIALPRNATARVGHNREPKELPKLTGDLTLNGKTVEVGFSRTSDDHPVPNPLPKAKQVGRG